MGKKKIIHLPKGYLSFSQVSLWISSKKRYIEIYFNNRDELRVVNEGMKFGTKVADALENEDLTNELLTDIAMELLPKYDVRDEEIKVELKTKDGAIMILGRPDSRCSSTHAFYEYKTGKVPWTQKKAEKSLQLKFYALLIYLKYKVVLKETALVWIETWKDDGVIKPTGRVETFTVKLSMKDILETMTLISRVAKEIEAEWVIHVPPKEEPF